MITKKNQKTAIEGKKLSKFLSKFSPYKERLSLNKEDKKLFDIDRPYTGCSNWKS